MIEIDSKMIKGVSISRELIKERGGIQYGISQFSINSSHTEIFFLDNSGRLWHADLNEYWNDQEMTVEAKQIKFKGV